MKHFDEMTAFLYLDGQLERGPAAEVRGHAAECAECRALISALESESRWLEESLREADAVPARFARPVAHARLPWGWITGLAMAAGGAITVWNGIVEPFEQQLNQTGFTGGNVMTMLLFSGAFWKGWPSVLSFLEFTTFAVFGILMVVLMERFWKRRSTLAMVLGVAALMVVGAPQPAHAGQVEHGKPDYTLPAGQTVNTDLIVFANFTRIDGTVNGDLYVWSREVEINGHVTGDVISMTQEARVNGQVDGNVRSYSQTLDINGAVGKNVLAAGQEIEISSEAKIGGSLIFGGGDVLLSGRVGRDLTIGAGSITLNGYVGGNSMLHANDLRVGSDANLEGTTSYHGRNPAEVAAGAKLASPVQFERLKEGPDYASVRYYWHRVEFWGAAFLFGLVLALLMPGFFAEGLRNSKKFLLSLGVGVLALVATPIVAVILCITVFGLGLGIATMLVYVLAMYAAQVLVGTWIGGAILGASQGTGALLGRMALGLAIIQGVELLPMHLGFIAKVIVLFWGLGAIVLTCFRQIRGGAAVAAA